MTSIDNLLWFHAFNRETTGGILSVLRDGPTPTTRANSKTQQNEELLGIHPPCVYVYLGFTVQRFGSCAFVLRQGDFEGLVSPFDTGGLVEHHTPVCEWEPDERKRFLSAYTWISAELSSKLRGYPGTIAARIGDYLGQNPPGVDGPHGVWPSDFAATIWLPPNTWPAWTWEGRMPNLIPVASRLYRWTCEPVRYAEVLKSLVAEVPDPALRKHVVQSYVRGGVSQLVATLTKEQAA